VQGATERLNEDSFFVAEGFGHAKELPLMRHQLFAPPATRVAAITRLHARSDDAFRQPFAASVIAFSATGARWVHFPHEATKRWLYDHPVADFHLRDGIADFHDFPDDFVPEGEGRGSQW
jgi:hypothetical protein